jgi:hypothetical protein
VCASEARTRWLWCPREHEARAGMRSGSRALAHHPDLLGRPVPRPLDGDVDVKRTMGR